MLADAAAAQVEERARIERSDGGAVRAFHVVGIDLELRLAVGVRVSREQQVVVGLLRVGLLGARTHDDAAREYATRLVVEHTVEILVTLTVVSGMVDRRMMIGVLLTGQEVQSVEDQPATRTRQDGADVVPRERRPECHHVQVDRTVPTLMRLCRRHVIGARALALDAMIIDPRRLSHHDFGDAVGPVGAVAERRVRLDDARARFAFEHDEIARMRDSRFA